MSTAAQDQTITQIANDVFEHCKNGDESVDYVEYDSKIWDKHYAPGWTSIEGDGKVYTGRDEVSAKYKVWQDTTTVHGCEVEGPFISRDGFSILFEIDMEMKDGSMPRMKLKEIAHYSVEQGKIVKEEFCFPPMPEQGC